LTNSHKIYILHSQGGGVDISSFGEDKANCSFILVSEENIREIQQNQGQRFDPRTPGEYCFPRSRDEIQRKHSRWLI